MTFAELDIAGVLISPVAVVIVGAWAAASAVRTLLNRAGLLRSVWHPALFVFTIFVILTSLVMLWEASP